MSQDRIAELERLLAAEVEASFTARKLLAEATIKAHPDAQQGRSFMVAEGPVWEDVNENMKKKVFGVLHLIRTQAKRELDTQAEAAYTAAIALLEGK